MRAHSLLFTRRGVRFFHWGIQLLAGSVIINLLSFLAVKLPGGALVAKVMGTVTPWLQIAASLLMLVGILLATAAPPESRVAPWGITILLLSAISCAWCVVVYAADLPIVALAGPVQSLTVGPTLLQGVLFAGLLAALCRWVATIERDGVEGGDSAWSRMPPDGLAAGSLAAGILAIGGFVANQWAERSLAGDWAARHFRELVDDDISGGAVGRAAPALAMQTIDGETMHLADYAGRVVVLNFWATWCPPCVAEIPDLARLAREIEGEGGVVIGISLEDPETIRPFVAAREIPYRIVSGSRWPAPFDTIGAIPVTYVIDGTGTIRAEFVGARSYEQFRQAYDAAKLPAAPPEPAEQVPEPTADPTPGAEPTPVALPEASSSRHALRMLVATHTRERNG